MGILRYGVHAALEEEADEILRRGAISHPTDPSLILTPSKLAHRRRREVFVASGTPDPATRRGVYGRALNRSQPHLNSRDGFAPPQRSGTGGGSADGLASFVERHLST